MNKERWSLEISGKVQGVWYRKSTQDKARELGLSGFVLNRSNGNVYTEAEGEVADLNAFMDWCRQGPSNAKVESVNLVAKTKPTQKEVGFKIKHEPYA